MGLPEFKKKLFVIKSSLVKKVTPFKFKETSKVSNKFVVYDPKIKKLIKFTSGIGRKSSPNYIPGAMDFIINHFKSDKLEQLDQRFLNNLIKKNGIFEDDHVRKSYADIKKKHAGVVPKNKRFYYEDPKKRFKIYFKSGDPESRIYGNTDMSYMLEIFINKKPYKFYIKAVNGSRLSSSRLAAQEMILQKYMEKHGVNIIKPKLAFSGDIHGKDTQFIMYDYTNLNNVKALEHTGYDPLFDGIAPLSERQKVYDYSIIKEKLKKIQFLFADRYVEDILPRNCYYEKTSIGYKLYISDLYVEHLNKKELIKFAKKEGLIK